MWHRLTTLYFFFFFNDTATTEIYTLSLHDALPISSLARSFWMVLMRVILPMSRARAGSQTEPGAPSAFLYFREEYQRDRKSTRLNSSHGYISYAVFCLKKKNTRVTLRLSFLSISL